MRVLIWGAVLTRNITLSKQRNSVLVASWNSHERGYDYGEGAGKALLKKLMRYIANVTPA